MYMPHPRKQVLKNSYVKALVNKEKKFNRIELMKKDAKNDREDKCLKGGVHSTTPPRNQSY